MQNKTIRKDHIITTAFEVWGNTGFHDTSLNVLSEKLGISKTALYRYFKNKEEILGSMEEWFYLRFFEMNNLIIEADSLFPEMDFIDRFISSYYSFFVSQPGLYVYFIRLLMRDSFSSHPGISVMRDRLIIPLRKYIIKENPGAIDHSLIYMGFLFTSVIFWLFLFFISDKMEWLPVIQPKPENMDIYLEKIGKLCKNGVLASTVTKAIPYRSIEEMAGVKEDELLTKNRIIKAIQDTVSEAGLEEASIDRIASTLGMKKSSLYFYFANKDEMLFNAISEEQEHFLALLEKRLSGYSSFCERSYLYMVFMSSYLLKDPSMLTMFNWLRFRNIRISLPPLKESYLSKLFAFVIEAQTKGELAQNPREPIAIGSFLHMLTFQEVIQSKRNRTSMDSFYSRMRIVHGNFLCGFSLSRN